MEKLWNMVAMASLIAFVVLSSKMCAKTYLIARFRDMLLNHETKSYKLRHAFTILLMILYTLKTVWFKYQLESCSRVCDLFEHIIMVALNLFGDSLENSLFLKPYIFISLFSIIVYYAFHFADRKSILWMLMHDTLIKLNQFY